MKLPAWLQAGDSITEADEARFETEASNWLKLHKNLRLYSELDCLKLIVYELRTKKRPDLVGRVKNKYNELRAKRELDELWRVDPDTDI